MKYCLVAVSVFCSVSGSCSLEPEDDYAFTDDFSELLLRQLKVMPPAICRCQDEYIMRDGSCIRSVECDPEEFCRSGRMVDGLCISPSPPVLQCPEDHISVCKGKDRAESPCCAKGETAEKVTRCKDGSEDNGDHCMRRLSHAPVNDCADDYALSEHGTECVKQEAGPASPTCVPPDIMSHEGDSCLTTIEQGFQYICPDGYECVANSKKKAKYYSPICSACAKTEETQPACRCPDGQEEADGYCYEAETFDACHSHKGRPRKQAPPKKKGHPAKDSHDHHPVIDCKPLGRVPCTCSHPYTLSCDGHFCTCITRELIPVTPICRGNTDDEGNCIAQVQKRLLYQCAEGFTCDVVNKKGRCNCVRITSTQPTKRCVSGKYDGEKCIEIMKEQKLVECPHGYAETCCDSKCTCTKTHLAMREIKCAPGAVSIQGECVFVSKPSSGCAEGLLRGGKCIQEYMAPPICGRK